MDALNRCELRIYPSAALHNLKELRRMGHNCRAIAMIKANAYGLGALPMGKILAESGEVYRFGVANIFEAVEISQFGIPVQIISSVLEAEIAPAVEKGFILPCDSYEHACLIDRAASDLNKTALCELKLDTGMGRLGIRQEVALETVKKIAQLKHLHITGAFTHLPQAGVGGEAETLAQLERFKTLVAGIRDLGIELENVHCAATDGILHYPEASVAPFNVIRPGASLWGMRMNIPDGVDIRPAAEMAARLIAVRELPAGATVGYCRMCKLMEKQLVGVVSAGYADGVPVALTNRGSFILNGRLAPILGRVSMDYTSISLAKHPDAKVGDEVMLFGKQGDTEIPIEEWGRAKQVVSQEITCSIGPRPKRVYLD